MSTTYVKRFEAVFLCAHLKGPKMSYKTAAQYMKKSEAFVSKWGKRLMTQKILMIYQNVAPDTQQQNQKIK